MAPAHMQTGGKMGHIVSSCKYLAIFIDDTLYNHISQRHIKELTIANGCTVKFAEKTLLFKEPSKNLRNSTKDSAGISKSL